MYFGRILAHFIQERECAMVLCSPLSLTLIPFWLDEGEDLEHRKAVWEAAPWPNCGHREREGPVGCRDPRRGQSGAETHAEKDVALVIVALKRHHSS